MKAIKIYKAGIHFGEENIIEGNHASGMINFSGCHLSCHFCYTPETSKEWQGEIYSGEQFVSLCEDLVRRGARNLNLISPTQFFSALYRPLQRIAASYGELLPVVFKISGYESYPALEPMMGLAHVFVPDFKVWDETLARQVGLPQRYGVIALEAIGRMMETHGTPLFTSAGKLSRGILIRHLLMPGMMDDSFNVVGALAKIGYRGNINFMTYFYDPKTRRVSNASPRDVALLASHASAQGMSVMVNGKQNHAFALNCANTTQLASGGSYVR